MKIKFAFSMLGFFIILPIHAQIYYVDASLGSDVNPGTSTDASWRTLSKVNASNFLPGDSILFKCGESWREELIVPNSGEVGKPIFFGQYGACDDSNKPLLIGSDVVNNWSLDSGDIYRSAPTLISQPYNLVENGSLDINDLSWGGYGGVSSSWANTGCKGTGGCMMVVVSSNGAVSTKRFLLKPGVNYRLEFKAKASVPVNLSASFNRDAEPWSVARHNYAATTNWLSYSYDFVPNQNLQVEERIRIDFSTSVSNAGVTYYIDDVVLKAVSTQYDTAEQIYVNGNYMRLAQYPDPDPAEPNNTYLKVLEDTDPTKCPAPAQPGDTSLFYDTDLVLDSSHAADMAGAGIHIRTTRWYIDDNIVAGYDAATKNISLEKVTQFGVCAGWGYYLDNKLWMLDSRGEWYYNRDTDQLYLWTPDSAAPSNRVEVSHRNGINVVARAFVEINGLGILRTRNGIDMRYSKNVTVRNMDIKDSHENGIVANNSSNAVIDKSRIENTVRQGLFLVVSKSAVITDNELINIGTIGAPKKSSGAIVTGYGSSGSEVRNNYINNSGYNGIYVNRDFLVTENRIYNVCQVLDDCGAVYVGGKDSYSENGVISNNIIVDTGSPVFGVSPANGRSVSQGVYLDSRTDNVTVSGNTIVNTDLGIQIHIADTNNVTGNTVYASRRCPVYISENSEMGRSGSNSVYNNQITNNYLFPIRQAGTYNLYGLYDDLDFVSIYGNNRYSALYGNTLVREQLNGATTSTLSEWKNNRGFDLNSTQFEQFGIAGTKLISIDGGTLLTNGDFDADYTGWGAWLGTKEWITSCIDGGCLKFTRDATSGYGLINNNRISVQKGQGYVLRFDLKGDAPDLSVAAIVRKAGANGEWYSVGLNKTLSVDENWQRYNFSFMASETLVYDAAIRGSGARVDFTLSATNQSIYIDNVRFEPATVNINDPADDTAIIINEMPIPASFACPDADVNKCNSFIRFSDETPVTWPMRLDARSSEIIIWTDNPMRDMDGDGIVDSNDLCPSSVSGVPTGIDGCAFTDVPGATDTDTGTTNVPAGRTSSGGGCSVSQSGRFDPFMPGLLLMLTVLQIVRKVRAAK